MPFAALLLIFALNFPVIAVTPELFTAIRADDAGADKDAPGQDGLTPLMYSVMTAGTPVMRAILDAGATARIVETCSSAASPAISAVP